MEDSNKKTLLFCVPLPPPLAGPEVSSQILLNSSLKDQFNIITLRTNVHTENKQRGHVSLGSIFKLFGLIVRVKWIIFTKRPKAIYTILNQNVTGFIRDSFIVLTGNFLGRKVVLHFRGSNFECFYKSRGPIFRAYIRFVLRRVDHFILQANWVKEKFKQFVPAERLHVIYNAIDEDTLKKATANDGKRFSEKINVLFLNHLSIAKGALELLCAAKAIIQSHENIDFTIAGDVINKEKNIFFGEDGRKIQFEDITKAIDQIKMDESVNKRIQFTGLITDVEKKYQLFKNADIFVLPSYSEGCPVSVMEAMAFGVPVVVTPVGALVDILKDGEHGKFSKVGEMGSLKDAIVTLAKDSLLREKISQNNSELIRSRFNVQTITSQLADVFESL